MGNPRFGPQAEQRTESDDAEEGKAPPLHMRTKKWARPELAACPWFTNEAESHRGAWRALFSCPEQPLHLELGCGKGVATARMVRANPDINLIAMDMSPDVLGDARRNIAAAWAGQEVPNTVLCRCDISRIRDFIAPEDGVERIHIQFCNPWPRRRHAKRRLTHPRQLMQYRALLPEGGEIWFKTDDDDLWADSLDYFAACGFTAVRTETDLHRSGFQPNYVSEHEARFAAQGIPIKFGIFRKEGADPEIDPMRWQRFLEDEEKP